MSCNSTLWHEVFRKKPPAANLRLFPGSHSFLWSGLRDTKLHLYSTESWESLGCLVCWKKIETDVSASNAMAGLYPAMPMSILCVSRPHLLSFLLDNWAILHKFHIFNALENASIPLLIICSFFLVVKNFRVGKRYSVKINTNNFVLLSY